jgi:hypothetical protein
LPALSLQNGSQSAENAPTASEFRCAIPDRKNCTVLLDGCSLKMGPKNQFDIKTTGLCFSTVPISGLKPQLFKTIDGASGLSTALFAPYSQSH